MKNKQIILVGNHSCSNRGDAAITRGLIQVIEERHPKVALTIWSRYPKGASKILGREVKPDLTNNDSNILVKISRRIFLPIGIDLPVLIALIACYLPRLKCFVPAGMKHAIDLFKQQDAVIQVGGSFFIDLYGLAQFRLIMCALLANRKVYLIGHSLGPFDMGIYKLFANWILQRCNYISIRDGDSVKILNEHLPRVNIVKGADTAWLVNTEGIEQKITKDKKVAFTFRRLAPFDRRLNISQEDYESEMAKVAHELISNGYKLEFYSTCTSFDGYHNDDRKVALSIKSQLAKEDQAVTSVINDELTDVELGGRLNSCLFIIGTRLHSSIIAMNFGIPAISIAYEHKTTGLYKDLGIEQLVIPLNSSFAAQSVMEKINILENDYDHWNYKISQKVEMQKSLALNSIENVMRLIV